MIAAVLLRLFYLIWHVLGPVLLMGRTTSSAASRKVGLVIGSA
jgi:hypothetical protein